MLHLEDILNVSESFRHLEEFVDRTVETNQFQALVDKRYEERDAHRRVFAFYGQPGIGKTMLLDRLEFECVRKKIPCSRINFEIGTYNNTIEILRELVRELDPKAFESWTQTEQIWFSPNNVNISDLNVNFATQGGGYNISGENVSNVNFRASGDMAGGSIIKNNTFNVASSTKAASDPSKAQTTLTDAFVDALKEFVQQRPAVIMFEGLDHEYCSAITRAWLEENLLKKVHEFKGYGLLPVVTYFNEPKYERQLGYVTYRAELKPLSEEHIIEYFRARQIREDIILEAARSCIKETEGIPAKVLAYVENLIAVQQEVNAKAEILNQVENKSVTLVPEIQQPIQETQISEPLLETIEQTAESAVVVDAPLSTAGPVETVQESAPSPAVMEEPQGIEPSVVDVAEQSAVEARVSDGVMQPETLVPEEASSADSARSAEAVESVEAEAQADSEINPPVQDPPQVEIEIKIVEPAESHAQIVEPAATPEPVAPAVEEPKVEAKAEVQEARQPVQPTADEAMEALRRSQERLKQLKSEGKSSTANMVDVLLEQQSPEVAEVARRCAVLRWFTADLIGVLADQPLTSEQITAIVNTISSWRFVQNFGYGTYAYRREVQQHLRNEIRNANPKLYADIHLRAYTYFDKKLGLSDSIDEMIWVNLKSDQITALREYLYYLLQVDVARGFNLLGQLFQSAQRLYMNGEAAILLKFANEVDQSTLSERYKNQLAYYEAALEFAEGEMAPAESKLRDLMTKPLEDELNAQVLGQMGVILVSGGKFDEAIKTFEQAQKIWQKLKRERERAKLSNNLGNAYMRKSDWSRAERSFNDALDGLKKAGTLSERALTLNNLGNVYVQKENFSKALEFYQMSLEVKNQIGDQFGSANTYTNIGTVYQRMAQDASGKKQAELRQQGADFYTRSLEIYRAFGARSSQGKLLFKLAFLYFQAGDKAKAREYLPDALDIFRDLEMPDLESASKLEKQLG